MNDAMYSWEYRKLRKAQPFKITQSGRFLGELLNKLGGPIMKIAKLLTKTY